MNTYYEKISKLRGLDEFKRIIEKWQVLSDNLLQYPVNSSVLLPDMLWIAKSGVGKTRMLRLMAEYLAACGNLIEFYGDVKYFEFMLCYCTPSEPFAEIQRLMDEIDNAAGFRSEFKGVVFIDINEWIGHCEEKHFISFMEYLSANSDNWLIVLSVTGEQAEDTKLLEAFVSMYLRIERIVISAPKTEELYESAEDFLSKYGLSFDACGKRALCATIDRLKENKYFDGFKTIKMLCQDIVYCTFSSGTRGKTVLSDADIAMFAADGEYIRKREYSIERVSKIGLLNR